MIPPNLLRAFATLLLLLTVLIVSMLAGGCGPKPPEFQAQDGDELGAMIRSGGLRYVQDQITGNCFAYAFIVQEGAIDSRARIGGAVITWVPCTPEMP